MDKSEGRLGDCRTIEFRQPLARSLGSSSSQKKKQTEANLRSRWHRELEYFIRWRCPEKQFLWLENPVTLNAKSLVGKKRFTGHFSRYQILPEAIAKKILMSIPQKIRTEAWNSIVTSVKFSSDISSDIEDIKENHRSKTTIKSLVDARLGQGRFRNDLMRKWSDCCAVNASGQKEVLRASHIKPWKISNDKERLDPNNGILLSANIDALFDRWLVTFNNDGTMLVSRSIPKQEKTRLRLPVSLSRRPTPPEQKYFDHHRKIFFSKEERGL